MLGCAALTLTISVFFVTSRCAPSGKSRRNFIMFFTWYRQRRLGGRQGGSGRVSVAQSQEHIVSDRCVARRGQRERTESKVTPHPSDLVPHAARMVSIAVTAHPTFAAQAKGRWPALSKPLYALTRWLATAHTMKEFTTGAGKRCAFMNRPHLFLRVAHTGA